LLPGLVAYAQQKDAITADDVDLLGWEFVLKLLQARERHDNRTSTYTYRPENEARVAHDFTRAIQVAFREEIGRMRQAYPG
jgi:hypothetical protein